MKKINLTKSMCAIVDDEDYEYLSQWKWRYQNNGYAVREKHIGQKDGVRVRKSILMHRLVNNTPDGLYTDHINGDRLDNRKINLRSCTNSENLRNRGSCLNSSSKYKGVSWDMDRNKWAVNIGCNGVRVRKRFDTEREAAIFCNDWYKEWHKEFARLNIIDD